MKCREHELEARASFYKGLDLQHLRTKAQADACAIADLMQFVSLKHWFNRPLGSI